MMDAKCSPGAWSVVAASLLEWRRSWRQFQIVDLDVLDDQGLRSGSILCAAHVAINGKLRKMGLGWSWQEVRPNLLALRDPLEISSNVRLHDEAGEPMSTARRLLHLNAAVNRIHWQAAINAHRRLADIRAA